MTQPFMDMEVNLRAQLPLPEACRHFAPVAVIIYASTRQIYGKPIYLPVDENHLLQPPDVNGINKLAAEYYHSLYTRVYGVRTVTDNTIELFDTGEQIRDFNFVTDVVDAMCRAAENPDTYGNVYNLSGEQASLKTVAELLIHFAHASNLKVVPFPEARKKIDIGDFQNRLLDAGLQTLVHYPLPNHLQPAFKNFCRAPLPVTESLANQILSLPFSHALNESTLNQITTIIKSVAAQLK